MARKAENARLLAEEEAASSAKPKPAPKKKGTKDIKPAGPGAIAAGGGLSPGSEVDGHAAEVESYAATGIDNALDLLEVVTAKMDKASVGQQAAGIERHPEVSICIIRLSERNFNESTAPLQGTFKYHCYHLMYLFSLGCIRSIFGT